MIKKIGVLTSGGDAPGMNSAIRSIARIANANGIDVYGIYDGYRGLINGDIKKLTREDVSNKIDKGGTFLGTARLPEFKNPDVMEEGIEQLQRLGIEALIVIGGDGSFRGASALSQAGINCIGIPGTIDNDLSYTDFTIGFDTALNTVVEAVDKLRDTSSSHHRCSVVEVMGNRCGDLALWAGIASGAEVVVTNQTGFEESEILETLKVMDSTKGKDHAIVIISEKLTDVHAFAKKVSQYTNFSGRATVLGHIQRGGSPTPQDRVLASRMGEKAVELLIEGVGGHCVGIKDNKIFSMPIDEALNIPRSSRRKLHDLFNKLV